MHRMYCPPVKGRESIKKSKPPFHLEFETAHHVMHFPRYTANWRPREFFTMGFLQPVTKHIRKNILVFIPKGLSKSCRKTKAAILAEPCGSNVKTISCQSIDKRSLWPVFLKIIAPLAHDSTQH